MARTRHRRPKSSTTSRTPREFSFADSVRADVDAKIARARVRRDAEKRAQNPGRISKDMEHRAPKEQRAVLKKHGFRVTKKGVVIDRPRDLYRRVIPGSRVRLMKGGWIKTTVGQRTDFIYGFTKKEKKEFAKNPAAMEKTILERLRKRFPTARRVRAKKIQTRLQWGAYQATKDFSPTYFTSRYFSSVSPEEIRKVGKKRAQPRADKLTGFHFVVHVPKASKARKRKEGRIAKRRKKR